MSKAKIMILVHVVLALVIMAVFLPALKTDDSGYKTKTVGVTPAQESVVEAVVPETVVVEEKIEEVSSVVEATVADVTAEVETASTDAQATFESTVSELTSSVDEAATTTQQTATATISDLTSAAKTTEEAVVPAAATTNALYSVIDGNKLDAHSYAGFKLYRNWCARCHGTYGQGMVGPNLADSLKIISKEQFYSTVENGKVGQIGSMPSWKANVQVMENRDQLYAYLKARSDGAIGVEKPKKQ